MNGDWNEDFSGHVEIPASGAMPETGVSEAGAPEPEAIPIELSATRHLLPPMRFPNMADMGLLVVLLIFGLLGMVGVTAAALHFHLFGVTTTNQAIADIRYQFGGQIIWYFLTLAGCMALFPVLWHTGFFHGLEWRFSAVLRARSRLIAITVFCLVLAVVDGKLMPGPNNAPIDEVFRNPGTAWFLLFFGTLLAPFFEELFFRGFLLPAFCTAYDWTAERTQHRPAPWPDEEGKTIWSMPAMIVSSVLVSIAFASIHGAQINYAVGPLLLLFCVSMVLCWVRLSLRSLAASTFVHASYNFFLFSAMVVATGGFRHMDKM